MIIDGETWACESCVRGHRARNCEHNDRPLTHMKARRRRDVERRDERRHGRLEPAEYHYQYQSAVVGRETLSSPTGTQSKISETNQGKRFHYPFNFNSPALHSGGYTSVTSSRSASEAGIDSDFWSMSGASDLESSWQNKNSLKKSNEVLDQLLSGFHDFRASPDTLSRGLEAPGKETAANSEPESDQARRKRGLNVGDADESFPSDASVALPAAKRSQGGDISQQTWACPFWRRDPERHQRCGLFALKRIRDVKQHLNRRHAPVFYCERCLVVFDSKFDHESHLVYESCQREPSAELNGISHAVRRKLCQRSDHKLPLADQWFAIWDLLFPGVPRPRSAFVDTELSVDLRLFSEYYQRRGSGMLMELLNSNDVWSMSGEDQQVRSHQILEEGLNKIYEDWLMSRSPGVIEPPPPSETTNHFSELSYTDCVLDAETSVYPTVFDDVGIVFGDSNLVA